MSLTIQQIITDAKRLAGRLKDRDTIADTLLNETNAITKKIDAMKQFQDEVDQLNEVANQKSHSHLLANIIQQENRELRAALEDYQITLEHIMSKYREHTSDEIYRTKIDFKSFQCKQYDSIIQRQAEKIQEMAAVMEKAASIDENRTVYNDEIIAALKAENQVYKKK